MTNPNNYPGVNVTVVGTAGGPYEVREFAKGSQAQLSVAVGLGYKSRETGEWVDTGTNWYNLVASPDYAADNWPAVSKGDKVRIDDARLEAKAYNTKDGEARIDLQLRFGTLTVVESKGARDNAPAAAGVTPF